MTLRKFAIAMIALTSAATAQSPLNDDCTGVLPALAAGVNPAPDPTTPGNAFTNIGATNSPGFVDPCGSGGHQDVFYVYTSTVDGQVRISTCNTPGLPAGTLADPMLSVYPLGACSASAPTSIACNDDSCGLLSSLTFTASVGVTYLVRVSSYYPSAVGTFRINIDPGLNDSCATAQSVGMGQVHGSTFGAPSGIPGSCQSSATVWYAMTTSTACDYWFTVEALDPAASLQIYTGSCGNLAIASACSDVAQFGANAVGIALFIAVTVPSGSDFALSIECPIPPPSNDNPSGAIAITEGVGPDGSAGYFTGLFNNLGATQSPFVSTSASALCVSSNYAPRSDVFFTYVSQSDGPATISAVPSSAGGGFGSGGGSAPDGAGGLPGGGGPGGGGSGGVPVGAAPMKTMMELYTFFSDPVSGSGYVHTACAHDGGSGSGVSTISFQPTAGTIYLIRVATAWDVGSPAPNQQTMEGHFQLTVSRPFTFTMDAPLGPGSLRLRNLNGPPNSPALTFLTLAPGAFPNGWLFGLDPTFADILIAVTYGPPFANLLDAAGGSSFVVGPGLPSFSLYGVTLKLGPLGMVSGSSPPIAFTIP